MTLISDGRPGGPGARGRYELDGEAADAGRATLAPARAGTAGGRPALLDGGPPPAPRTLVEVFAAALERHRDEPALDDGRCVLSYRQLHAAASDLAARLALCGVGRGDRVGIRIADGSSDLYVGVLGALLCGAAYVPVDAGDPQARADHVFSEAGVAAVVGDGLELAVVHEGSGDSSAPGIDDECWVIFTSGTTGRPKGVAVRHRSASAFVDAEARLWRAGPGDRVLAGLSIAFDASCEEIWTAWRNGATLVPAPRSLVKAGADLGRFLVERRVTVVSTVPTIAAMWEERDLAGVRLVILGGEALPDALAARLANGRREVWNTYGPTEATVVSTAARVERGKPVTIGEPIAGWSAAVLGEDGSPVPAGEVGELVLGGVGLGRYLDPALDAERFAPVPSLGWQRAYLSGDLVRLGADGLEYVGRRDGQVKVGGRRLELGEVESYLSAVRGVRQAVAALRHSAAGDPVLVGYYSGAADPGVVRSELAEHLPSGISPVVVRLESLPLGRSGKVDRSALPWPPPSEATGTDRFSGTERLVAQCWQRHLGVTPSSSADDFFELGGASLAAARVASELRKQFPSLAVAELYRHRRLGELAARLDELVPAALLESAQQLARKGAGLRHLATAFAVFLTGAPPWVIATLALNDILGSRALPTVGWPWLLAAWLLLDSTPGHVLMVAAARRLLLSNLAPGRYPRRSGTAMRVWFVDRLQQHLHIARFAGTPFAPAVTRALGVHVGPGAKLGTIPSAAGLLRLGKNVTLEPDADLDGFCVVGSDLVVGTVEVGDGARIGTRAVLMPGAVVGARAEVEPGAVIEGEVPAGERWAGSPAACAGPAGVGWPEEPPAPAGRSWRLAYGAWMLLDSFVPLVAMIPGLALLFGPLGFHLSRLGDLKHSLYLDPPVMAATFDLTYAVLVALLARLLGRLITPGWHGPGRVAFASWAREDLMDGARTLLFPLFSTIFVRPWLRLMGLRVGRRSEVCNAVGITPLVRLGAGDFITDDVVFNTGRARDGWLHLEPIELDDTVFVGNSAIIAGGTTLARGSLVGAVSSPPRVCPADSSWFGVPAIEFPRPATCVDTRRTVDPPARLVAARVALNLVRILLPTTLAMALGMTALDVLDLLGRHLGLAGMIGLAPAVMLATGVVAALATAGAKWVLIGRYRAGEHPLWSSFVWRDEIVNACQELLAFDFLLGSFASTPVMSWYLRLCGAQVGRDVWCDTLTITEFDVVSIADGAAIDRWTCVESHLFHDRVMRIGPISIGTGSTLGPASVLLPDTVVGDGVTIGGRSVVLRGEELPPGTRWHGAPVVAR